MKIREEKGIVRNDMIHLLMQAKRENLHHNNEKQDKESKIWNDDDLAAQCFLFFFGGFNTVLNFHSIETRGEVSVHIQASDIRYRFFQNSDTDTDTNT
jgi:hypothetical protein